MTLGSPELITQMVQSGTGHILCVQVVCFSGHKGWLDKVLEPSGQKTEEKVLFDQHGRRSICRLQQRSFAGFIKEYRFFVPF